MEKLPSPLFISHGGGPLPLLGDPQHAEMVLALKELAGAMPRPRAIVTVSAHWEEQIPTITAARHPELIYDYYGFPPESYEIQYPCDGEPSLANELFDLVEGAGIKARLDEKRGLDHGVFVPLAIMYPEANIPCVQLSLVNTLDPLLHIEIGRALQGLHERGVLLLGSGFSFHNLRAFFEPDSKESRQLNRAFEDWLEEVCVSGEYSESQRSKLLCKWESAPGARYCHPREEHLMPLHVCYGASEAPCTKRIEINIMNKRSSLYIW
jgi:4,5-DOPA dioxygenase extradiol